MEGRTIFTKTDALDRVDGAGVRVKKRVLKQIFFFVFFEIFRETQKLFPGPAARM
jgi:hypothetical protein